MSKMFDSKVYKIPMDAPDDVEGLEKFIENGEINPNEIVGMIFTNEGDHYSSSLVTCIFTEFLSKKLGISRKEVLKKIPMPVCRGLTGLMIPHVAVFTRKEVHGKETGKKRLVIAGKVTRDLLPEEIGTMAHVREVAKVVRELMEEAGIEDPKDVKLVWVKNHHGTLKSCYGFLEVAIKNAAKRGKKLITENFDELGARARGAGALGVGVALGDIDEAKLSDESITKDLEHVYTLRALSSSGSEHPHPPCQVILFGNSTKSISNRVIGRGYMKDGIDVNGIKEALRDAGLKFECCPTPEEQKKIEYIFLGSGLHTVSTIRGQRQTLKTNFMFRHISWTIQKAAVHALAAGLTGEPMIEVCSAVEHMHPPGGCTVFVIVRAE